MQIKRRERNLERFLNYVACIFYALVILIMAVVQLLGGFR